MKTLYYSGSLILVLALMATIFAYVFPNNQLSGATPNMQARVLVATTTSVGPQTTITVFSALEYCASRVVTTGTQPISLSFHDGITVSPTVGHLQGASTTVAYDSGLYGCGAVTARAGASTTITTTTFVY